jgi:zinc/manganese transport system substrate-binding protein
MPPLRFFAFLFLALSALTATAKPLVVSTNTILNDLVSAVGGDLVDGRCLLPPGADPHSYEPNPQDIRLLTQADLVVVNGLGLETWLQKLVENAGLRRPALVASTGVVPLHVGKSVTPDFDERELGEIDPHAWQDPHNVRLYVENIRDALAGIDPAHADVFAKNTEAYCTRLDELDVFAREQISSLPSDQRKLVTSHDALHYLARTYGLTIVPVSGLSPDQEPSAKSLAALINFIRDQHVRAIFVESTTNPKIVSLVAQEAGVDVVGSLYTDSLGPPGSPGATFAGMFRSNIEMIVKALK